jgi:hypothetical protein
MIFCKKMTINKNLGFYSLILGVGTIFFNGKIPLLSFIVGNLSIFEYMLWRSVPLVFLELLGQICTHSRLVLPAVQPGIS